MWVQNIGIALGVLGFIISMYNLIAAVRNRTVNPQPQLLAELRGYLDVAVKECRVVRGKLNFDRYLLHTGNRPDIPECPPEFERAIERLPELGFTITSVGQSQIDLFHILIRDAKYNWEAVKNCIDAEPININGLDFANRLRCLCLIVDKFFPAYVEALTHINKGHMWKRYKYRDHHAVVNRIFRWTPLSQAVSEYEHDLQRV